MSDSETSGSVSKKRKIIPSSCKVSNKVTEHVEKKKRQAPFELLTEFLYNVMKKDYQMALYYCSKILSYEPDNWIVNKFYPLIVEKLNSSDLEGSSSESSESHTSVSTKSSGRSPLQDTSSEDDTSPEDISDENDSLSSKRSKEKNSTRCQKCKKKATFRERKSSRNLQYNKMKKKCKSKNPATKR